MKKTMQIAFVGKAAAKKFIRKKTGRESSPAFRMAKSLAAYARKRGTLASLAAVWERHPQNGTTHALARFRSWIGTDEAAGRAYWIACKAAGIKNTTTNAGAVRCDNVFEDMIEFGYLDDAIDRMLTRAGK